MHSLLALVPLLAAVPGVSAYEPPAAASAAAAFTRSYSSYFQKVEPTQVRIQPDVAPSRAHVVPAATNTANCAFWMEDIAHQGVAAFNSNSSYPVFRNVMDYGAVGDGIHDDTAAINLAINSSNRFGPSPYPAKTSTNTPAVVYFPYGIYNISGSLVDFYYTQIIGNPNCLPTILVAKNFSGQPQVFDGDQYQPGGFLGFGATNVFYRQIRNFIIDSTAYDHTVALDLIHWPTAQATSLQNIVFNMPNVPGTMHAGVTIESGSGGFVTELTFNGGRYGLNVGNQQFTMRNLTFSGQQTAINQVWDWGWTYKNLVISNCSVGISIDLDGSGNQNNGAVVVIDSLIVDTPVAIASNHGLNTYPPAAGALIVENLQLDNVPKAITGVNGATVLAGTTAKQKTKLIKGFAQGHEYLPAGPQNKVGTLKPDPRPSVLLGGPNNGYYELTKPQYQNLPVSMFVSVRTAGAVGNGIADDSVFVQKALTQAAKAGKVCFFDAGTYRVTKTILIPAGSKVVGESYSVIMSSGTFFSNINSPQPVVRVGNVGSKGTVQWSDMIVSTQGAQAGATLIEWNLATTTNVPSGMWDVHTRIGGFIGSNLQGNTCPAVNSSTPVVTAANLNKACIGAYMSMHITPSATGLYMENNWLWTADHDIDANYGGNQITIYTGRGLYVESTVGRIWMYGTAVEHHSKYQYHFANTKNIIAGQIQTETPYYQPNPNATIPFPRNAKINDPIFPSGPFANDTAVPNANAYGLLVQNTDPLLLYGAGHYSFFNNYSTSCSDAGNGEVCQSRIVNIDNKSSVYLYDLHTVGTRKMITIQTGGNLDDIADYSDNISQSTFIDTIGVFRT